MKIGTKLAIIALAAILSLAAFGVIVDALSVRHIVSAATPVADVTVRITG